ncbi:MAG TPA: hypothetical protein VJU54_09100, partial [Nitrospiraceae bacterium]|nr:hypothetical protein [Nitrospiraceae bacterium]
MRCLLRLVRTALLCFLALVGLVSCGGDSGAGSSGVSAPGGFVEKAGSAIRTRWTSEEIQSFIPAGRDKFVFPAPYQTEAVRITTASDCNGSDCVWPVAYSYWRNINNHVGSDHMLIFLGTDRSRGGQGPMLFRYDKATDQVSNLGPLFDSASALSWANGSGWYFSASLPTALYLNDGPRMVRYDVMNRTAEVVFDLTAQFGADRQVAQMYSSNDDQVHSATLRAASSGEDLGCVVYFESTRQFRFVPKIGDFDECQVDKSGRYLMTFEQIDGRNGIDNRIFDLQDGTEERVLNLPNAAAVGHHDFGYGYVVGHDNFNPLPNATLTRSLDASLTKGPVDHRDYNWELGQVQHISHTNAKPGIPKEQQYACGSNADRVMYAQNEIICFPLDGSLDQLVVAPVMTSLDASGG